ncbi:MAG TPA: 7-cyano-7-deazaguanine synthase, partial [Nitrospiria bacterium]|nr:7-cyano-7-deazaguanine synthase [Nitrospiria bacterium]
MVEADKKKKKLSPEDQVCVLISGGLDSCVLAAELSHQYLTLFPVYVKGGLFWEPVELFWLQKFLSSLKTRTIQPLTILRMPLDDLYQNHWSLTGKQIPAYHSDDRKVYLPGRNILLLAKTAVYCEMHGIQNIALGPLKANPFPDSTPGFFKTMQNALDLGLNARLNILTPLAKLSKADVLKKGAGLRLDFTFSCLSPQGYHHCGRCNKCAERILSFRNAGIEDKT